MEEWRVDKWLEHQPTSPTDAGRTALLDHSEGFTNTQRASTASNRTRCSRIPQQVCPIRCRTSSLAVA